jgi:hypothetical protein
MPFLISLPLGPASQTRLSVWATFLTLAVCNDWLPLPHHRHFVTFTQSLMCHHCCPWHPVKIEQHPYAPISIAMRSFFQHDSASLVPVCPTTVAFPSCRMQWSLIQPFMNRCARATTPGSAGLLMFRRVEEASSVLGSPWMNCLQTKQAYFTKC